MSPAKNSNANFNISINNGACTNGSNNCSPGSKSNFNEENAAGTAPAEGTTMTNIKKVPENTIAASAARKVTGTIPKTAATTVPTGGTVALTTTTPTTQETHQPAQQQRQLRKNTEIVAPIRRELKDLNDYLLSSEAASPNLTSTTNSEPLPTNSGTSYCRGGNVNHQSLAANGKIKFKSSQYSFNKDHKQKLASDNLTTTNDYGAYNEYEHSNDIPRFCYPVRPIPRRNHQQQHRQPQQNRGTTVQYNDNIATPTNLNTTNHAAAIGVVIPTTPGLVASATTTHSSGHGPSATATLASTSNRINKNHNSTSRDTQESETQELQQQLIFLHLQQIFDDPRAYPTNLLDLVTALTATSLTPLTGVNTATAIDSNLLNQLKILQHFLNFNKISGNVSQTSLGTAIESVGITSNTSTSYKTVNKNHKLNMVIEGGNEPKETGPIVNSTSLEDVPVSEMSDNRAQSIQSLHSTNETPTPESAPTYEDLQERLEDSTRNIKHIKTQQEHLVRLQNAAKQHLSEMEQLRKAAGNLSFDATSSQKSDGTGDVAQNGVTETNVSCVPDYESIDQVQSDMSNLVERMQNLTHFLQHQQKFSNMLGEDAPELLAEQQLLENKLESLRLQRDEMRTLVGELEDVNRNADISPRVNHSVRKEVLAPLAEKKITDRVVPVEYTRKVPIEMHQATEPKQNRAPSGRSSETGHTAGNRRSADSTTEASNAKAVDIDDMKIQLQRLKEMMDTVNLIEHQTSAPNAGNIRRSPQRDARSRSSTLTSFDREQRPLGNICMPVMANYAHGVGSGGGASDEEALIAHKMAILNNVTSDLRAQAENLQAERDRILCLKADITRRKEQAAAAVQMGDDALIRHSLTPTPTNRQRYMEETEDCDRIKEEYNQRKKQFDELCRSLEDGNASDVPKNIRQEILSEADDEAEEEPNESHIPVSNLASYHNLRRQELQSDDRSDVQSSNISVVANDGSASRKDNLSAAAFAWGAPFHYSAGASRGHISNQPVDHGTPQNFAMTSQNEATAPPSTSDCVCSASNSVAPGTVISGNATQLNNTSSTVNASTQMSCDSLLMQQFLQTHQMLISSVQQCNQMMWYQQREIDNIAHTVQMLQERLYAMGIIPLVTTATNRSESVPPVQISGVLPNNLYMTANRAQSEQPAPQFLPAAPLNTSRAAFINQQHQQQLMQQQQFVYQQLQQRQQRGSFAGVASGNDGFATNFTSDTQQHQQNATLTSKCIYSVPNNVAQPTVPCAQSFNNELPQSPLASGGGAGPGPIFMHHHNNTIHQNNANLRSQNHYANNLQHHQQQPHNNIAANGVSTLNNQVPPGNRANNYWDNFRSYSRQNLLSTNSNKSNEEQRLLQQQAVRSNDLTGTEEEYSPRGVNGRRESAPRYVSYRPQAWANPHNANYEGHNNNNYRSCPYRTDIQDEANNKHLTSLARSRINLLLKYRDDDEFNNNSNNNNNFSNSINPSNSIEDLVQNNNIELNLPGLSSSVATSEGYAPLTAHNIRNLNRNMNLNYGDSSHYQQNKVPAYKPTCRAPTTPSTLSSGIRKRPQYLQQTVLEDIVEDGHHNQNSARNAIYMFEDHVNAGTPRSQSPGPRISGKHARSSAVENALKNDYACSEFDMVKTSAGATTNSRDALSSHDYPSISNNTVDHGYLSSRNTMADPESYQNLIEELYASVRDDVLSRLQNFIVEKRTESHVGDRKDKPSDQQQRQGQPHAQINHLDPVSSNVKSSAALAQVFNDVGKHDDRKLFWNQQQQQIQHQQQQQQKQQQYEQFRLQRQRQFKDEEEQCKNYATLDVLNEPDSDQKVFESSNPNTSDTFRTFEDGFIELDDVSSDEPYDNPESHEMNSPSTDADAISNITYVKVSPELNGNMYTIKNDRLANGEVCLYVVPSTVKVEQPSDLESESSARNESLPPTTNVRDEQLDAINYMIAQVKLQIPLQSVIDDGILAEIARITASVAQRMPRTPFYTAASSPKKMYNRMRRLNIPKHRDDFIVWYKSYLVKLNTVEENIANIYKDANRKSNNQKLMHEQMSPYIMEEIEPNDETQSNSVPNNAANTQNNQSASINQSVTKYVDDAPILNDEEIATNRSVNSTKTECNGRTDAATEAEQSLNQTENTISSEHEKMEQSDDQKGACAMVNPLEKTKKKRKSQQYNYKQTKKRN